MADYHTEENANPGSHLTTFTLQPTTKQIKDAYVRERIDRWRLKAETLDNEGLLEKMAHMTFASPHNPQPGLIIPNLHGGYEYIPLEKGALLHPDTPDDHVLKVNQLLLFHKKAENARILREVEIDLDNEIEEKCFWEFLDTTESGDASQLSFSEKVELVAMYRLSGRHADIPPYHRRTDAKPDMNVLVQDVSGFGNIESRRLSFTWNESDIEIRKAIESFSSPDIASGLKELVETEDTRGWPPSMVKRLRKMLVRLEVQERRPDDPDFLFCVTAGRHKHESPLTVADATWSPLNIAEMRSACKKTGGWAMVMRPWKRRLAEAWSNIQQKEQDEYNRTLETGETYFTTTGEEFSFDDVRPQWQFPRLPYISEGQFGSDGAAEVIRDNS